MSNLGTDSRPLRVAIIGSGPSGFYAVEALQKSDAEVQIDIYDRLATPFGLVRHGVAPDHQKIKSVVRIYDKLAAADNVNFFGNVTVGRDITVEELGEYYDALIYAVGAESDRRLNIPGEDLAGSHTATAFVAWYNGHPDYRDHTFDLSCEAAAVIGQGNVAIDVCRVLSKTVDELKETDIAQHALDALAESKIRDVYMIGRRGPVQAKFTLLEIKEMGKLADCDPVVLQDQLDYDDASREELEDAGNKSQKRVVSVLEDFAQRESGSHSRRLHVLFQKSPKQILGDARVEGIELESNRLEGEPFRIKAVGTGETETLPCGIVFRSVGYRGVPLAGVPFDESWGGIPNEDGRILDDGSPLSGRYVVGWIKRGPSGVIGTNKPDSYATVDALLADLPSLTPCAKPDTEAALALAQSRVDRIVTFDDWKSIDAIEVERGSAIGKPREKFTSTADIFAALDH